MKKLLLATVFVFTSYIANSQILISLLLGDKLNSDKLEFGLEGGANFSNIDGLKNADYKPGFNLGFYFDIKIFKNPNWMFHTGVIVKSPMGAADLPVYSLSNSALDSSFQGGSIKRKLSYFNVPVMVKYSFKNHIFVKGGIMLGLRSKMYDQFNNEIKEDDDLEYVLDIKKQYNAIDAGVMAGLGYRLMRGNGMNFTVQYYRGLVDITVDDSTPNQYNHGFYITAGIPIGKSKQPKDAPAEK